jgi:AcrR family transcriptional regulator
MQSCSERTMTLAHTASADEPRTSLRERKKLATRRSLRRTALDLVAERGFANVTVDDIAEAADVSPRTFFNYFPSKEAALFGTDPDRVAELRQRIVQQAPGQPVLDVLRMVMVSDAQAVADELSELGGDPADWLRRIKEARTDPHLRAAHAAQMAMVERAITEGLAERLGTDPERDPYPGLLAATAAGAFRASMTFWAASGGTVPLSRLIDLAFRALADGLPENCALRHVSAGPGGRPLRPPARSQPGGTTLSDPPPGNVADRKDTH